MRVRDKLAKAIEAACGNDLTRGDEQRVIDAAIDVLLDDMPEWFSTSYRTSEASRTPENWLRDIRNGMR